MNTTPTRALERLPDLTRFAPLAPVYARSHVRDIAAAVLLGGGVLAALLLVVPGTLDGTDGWSMLNVTRALVEHGSVAVGSGGGAVPGLHGQFYSKYGPGQSLAAAPLYLLGQKLEVLVPVTYRPELPELAASTLPALATAATTALLVLAAIELGAASGGALLLGLIYALTTPAAVYAAQWFSEPLTGCFVVASFYLLLRDRARPTLWRPLLAGLAAAAAVATRIETALLIPPLWLYAVLPAERRGWRAAAFGLPVVLTLGALALYNLVRFGKPLETGYGQSNNSYDYRDTHPPHTLASFAEGLYGLLISPGKGLIAYAPVTLLAPFGAVALWTRRRADTVLLLLLIVIDLVGHANLLIRWLGGWSWGPRFLMPVLPLILLLLVPFLASRQRRVSWASRAIVFLAIIGLAVQIPALLVDQPHAYIYQLEPQYRALYHNNGMVMTTAMESDYTHRLDLSPILNSWRMLGDDATWRTPGCSVAPRAIAARSCAVAPHTWWNLLTLQGVSGTGVALVCAALAALALLATTAAFTVLRQEE